MTKLGIHIVQGSRNGYGEFLEAIPRVVLSVDDGGALIEAKQKTDGKATTIFRDTTVYLEAPTEAVSGNESLAIEAANVYYPMLKEVWERNPANYYTITNEQGGNSIPAYRSLVAYEKRIMQQAELDGFRCVMLNLAGGSPGDFDIWKLICVPLLEWGAERGHVYGRHAYGGGDLSTPDGNTDRPMREAAYLPHSVKMFVTEAGIDGGMGYGGDVRFTDQSIYYDSALAEYPNILGYCMWTLGDWQGANCQSALPMLADYLKNNPQPPEPPEPPIECVGLPRIQYKRRYLLLPPSADSNWYKAAIDGWGASPLTMGPSADDSGLGDLDEKEAWVVNPQLWGDGLTEEWYNRYYPGTRYVPIIATSPAQLTAILNAMLNENPPQPPEVDILYGIHDEPGGEWSMQNGLSAVSLHSVALGTNSTAIDFTILGSAGVRMLVRLNYGYGSNGTLPPSYDQTAQDRFVEACLDTMRNSRGVWGWIIANEPNNPNEWPNGQPIQPEQVTEIYNRIYNGRPHGARIAPPAVDPYYGPNSDNREYWQHIIYNIAGADFLTYHPKTQDSDPNNIDSDAKFTDPPLQWQYLHLKAYQPLMDVVPPALASKPSYMTEVNPQRKQDGSLGWEPSLGAEWVARAAAHFDTFNETSRTKVEGVIFYRWDFDPWAIYNLDAVLNEIKRVS